MADDDCLRNCFALVSSVVLPKTPALAIVCIPWRQLYQRFHRASSHLDLVVSGSSSDAYHRYADILAAHSLHAPLHLNIRECDDQRADLPYEHEVSRLATFLVPLMPEVCAIEINFRVGSQALLESVMGCWIRHGSSSLAKILRVWSGSLLRLEAVDQPGLEQISSTAFEEFFRPLRTLALEKCSVRRHSELCRGLLEVYLGLNGLSQTQSDIVGLLAACPRLRSLAVQDAKILEQEDTVEPVCLSYLESLSLSQYNFQPSFKTRLPSLITGPDSISVTIRISNNPDFISEARSFFRRSSAIICVWSATSRQLCILICGIALPGTRSPGTGASRLWLERPRCAGSSPGRPKCHIVAHYAYAVLDTMYS
jgi:hypothetical protein